MAIVEIERTRYVSREYSEFDGSALSIEPLVGGGAYRFRVPTATAGAVVGFAEAPDPTGYADISHGLYFASGFVQVIESGVLRTAPRVYLDADVFYVARLETSVCYVVDDGAGPYDRDPVYDGEILVDPGNRTVWHGRNLPGRLLYESAAPSAVHVVLKAALLDAGASVLDMPGPQPWDAQDYSGGRGSGCGCADAFGAESADWSAGGGYGRADGWGSDRGATDGQGGGWGYAFAAGAESADWSAGGGYGRAGGWGEDAARFAGSGSGEAAAWVAAACGPPVNYHDGYGIAAAHAFGSESADWAAGGGYARASGAGVGSDGALDGVGGGAAFAFAFTGADVVETTGGGYARATGWGYSVGSSYGRGDARALALGECEEVPTAWLTVRIPSLALSTAVPGSWQFAHPASVYDLTGPPATAGIFYRGTAGVLELSVGAPALIERVSGMQAGLAGALELSVGVPALVERVSVRWSVPAGALELSVGVPVLVERAPALATPGARCDVVARVPRLAVYATQAAAGCALAGGTALLRIGLAPTSAALRLSAPAGIDSIALAVPTSAALTLAGAVPLLSSGHEAPVAAALEMAVGAAAMRVGLTCPAVGLAAGCGAAPVMVAARGAAVELALQSGGSSVRSALRVPAARLWMDAPAVFVAPAAAPADRVVIFNATTGGVSEYDLSAVAVLAYNGTLCLVDGSSVRRLAAGSEDGDLPHGYLMTGDLAPVPGSVCNISGALLSVQAAGPLRVTASALLGRRPLVADYTVRHWPTAADAERRVTFGSGPMGGRWSLRIQASAAGEAWSLSGASIQIGRTRKL